jgi:hypothetical protein
LDYALPVRLGPSRRFRVHIHSLENSHALPTVTGRDQNL